MLEKLLLGLLILWGLRSALSRSTPMKPKAEAIQNDLNTFIRKYAYPKSYVEFWMDVSQMETDNFTSPLFVNMNNPWGMRVAERRETTQINSFAPPGSWGAYDNLSDAALDICLWMDYNKFSKNISQLDAFVVEMKNFGYFKGESAYTYYQKILAIKHRIK